MPAFHPSVADYVDNSKDRTKGKIKALFRLVQRDFVLVHLDLASIEEISKAFGEWLRGYHFGHSHKGVYQQCPTDLYTPSLKKLTSEELEFNPEAETI